LSGLASTVHFSVVAMENNKAIVPTRDVKALERAEEKYPSAASLEAAVSYIHAKKT